MTSYKNSIRNIKISKHDILEYASLHPDDDGWNHWDSIPDYVYDYIKCLELEIASLKSREEFLDELVRLGQEMGDYDL